MSKLVNYPAIQEWVEKKATPAQMLRFVTLGVEIEEAKRKNDEARKQEKMNEMFNLTRQTEESTGFKFINLQPGNYEQCMAELASLWFAVAVKKKRRVENCTRQTLRFRTANEANQWLVKQDHLAQVEMKVRHHSGGGFGMYTVEIDDIVLDCWISPEITAYNYGISCEQKKQLYVQPNEQAYRAQWAASYPAMEVLSVQKCQSSGSLIGGNVGYVRLINAYFFVLYRFRDQERANKIREKIRQQRKAGKTEQDPKDVQ